MTLFQRNKYFYKNMILFQRNKKLKFFYNFFLKDNFRIENTMNTLKSDMNSLLTLMSKIEKNIETIQDNNDEIKFSFCNDQGEMKAAWEKIKNEIGYLIENMPKEES